MPLRVLIESSLVRAYFAIKWNVLPLASPKNDCSTVLAEVKVAFNLPLLFLVDFVATVSLGTLHLFSLF